MKIRLWAGSVLAGSAIATGACLACAGTASAAPNDGGSGTTATAGDRGGDSARDTGTGAGHDALSGSASTRRESAARVERNAERNTHDDASADDSATVERSVTGPGSRIARAERMVRDPAPGSGPATADRSVGAHLVSRSAVLDSAVSAPSVEVEDTVALAVAQIGAAQQQLLRETWGRGNISAGIATVVPQLLLANAEMSLEQWRSGRDDAQQLFASTVGVPIAHDVARLGLAFNNELPAIAEYSIVQASQMLSTVRRLVPGEGIVEVTRLLGSAQTNGMVFRTIPITMNLRDNSRQVETEPIVYVSVNGGPFAPVLLDTGSTGLIIDPRFVGPDLGTPIDVGLEGSYGDGKTPYFFDTYSTTVDFGNGAITAPTTVGVVETGSIANFSNYNYGGGYVGILGVGSNASGPIQNETPLRALPGLLGMGLLIDESGDYIVFGPNPLPARAVVPGTDTTLQLRIDDGPARVVKSVLDTGGIFGQIPMAPFDVDPGWADQDLPAGTVISVYTADGETLLYRYTTTALNSPSWYEDDVFNTGYAPFSLGLIYVDYAGGGAGASVFDQPFVDQGPSVPPFLGFGFGRR